MLQKTNYLKQLFEEEKYTKKGHDRNSKNKFRKKSSGKSYTKKLNKPKIHGKVLKKFA